MLQDLVYFFEEALLQQCCRNESLLGSTMRELVREVLVEG